METLAWTPSELDPVVIPQAIAGAHQVATSGTVVWHTAGAPFATIECTRIGGEPGLDTELIDVAVSDLLFDTDAGPVGDRVLSSFLADPTIMPAVSLETLSGDRRLARPGLFPSGLMKRVAKAWTTPLSQLSCAHARVLVGQKFGLRWLASPVAEFLIQHPRAECDLYPGDLICGALRAHREFLEFAPDNARALFAGDLAWMEATFAFDPDGRLYLEAIEDLASARRLLGLV
jgi:hypothetical protein